MEISKLLLTLTKKEKRDLIERLLQNPEFREELLDIVLFYERQKEPSRPLKRGTMQDFWGILVPTLVGKSFYTLKQRHEFRVEEMGDNHLLIITTRGPRRIPRRELEAAWEGLTRQGKLTQQQIVKELSSFNSAYVAALLTKIEGVSHTPNPVTLSYKRGAR